MVESVQKPLKELIAQLRAQGKIITAPEEASTSSNPVVVEPLVNTVADTLIPQDPANSAAPGTLTYRERVGKSWQDQATDRGLDAESLSKLTKIPVEEIARIFSGDPDYHEAQLRASIEQIAKSLVKVPRIEREFSLPARTVAPANVDLPKPAAVRRRRPNAPIKHSPAAISPQAAPISSAVDEPTAAEPLQLAPEEKVVPPRSLAAAFIQIASVHGISIPSLAKESGLGKARVDSVLFDLHPQENVFYADAKHVARVLAERTGNPEIADLGNAMEYAKATSDKKFMERERERKASNKQQTV